MGAEVARHGDNVRRVDGGTSIDDTSWEKEVHWEGTRELDVRRVTRDSWGGTGKVGRGESGHQETRHFNLDDHDLDGLSGLETTR